MSKERIILGIDPGTSIMGYGIIKIRNNSPELVSSGIITLTEVKDHGLKLKMIFERTIQIIEGFYPDELAIEAQFFGKNVQSMLKLGRAQGVAIAAAISRGLPYSEYAPKKIKQSITGNGNASKEQVAAMLMSNFKVPKEKMPKYLDATDGLAAAMCHYYQSSGIMKEKNYSGWEAFIKKNPKRIKD